MLLHAGDWRTDSNDERARQDLQDYFEAPFGEIAKRDIQDAVGRFPDFLQIRFYGELQATITHMAIDREVEPAVLRYLLGFGPDLSLQDARGKIPTDCLKNPYHKDILDEYAVRPWSHRSAELDMVNDTSIFSSSDTTSSQGTSVQQVATLIGVVGVLWYLYQLHTAQKKEVVV